MSAYTDGLTKSKQYSGWMRGNNLPVYQRGETAYIGEDAFMSVQVSRKLRRCDYCLSTISAGDWYVRIRSVTRQENDCRCHECASKGRMPGQLAITFIGDGS